MKFLRKFCKSMISPEPTAREVVLCGPAGHANGADLDIYYSILRENRPYVLAMRDVARDALRSI